MILVNAAGTSEAVALAAMDPATEEAEEVWTRLVGKGEMVVEGALSGSTMDW
jgi:hypothetical protein